MEQGWLLDSCLFSLASGQNFNALLMKMKIQDDILSGSSWFEANSSLSIEVTSGVSYCVKILPDDARYPIRSGIGNGIDILLDLETFDNGDLQVLGDGLDVLVTDQGDYSLPKLNGLSVGPGSFMEIEIKPSMVTITEAALAFDYHDRKCVDPFRDTALKDLDGLTGNYSLSNCLVSATLTQIYDTCPGLNETSSYEDIANAEGPTLECVLYHMGQVSQ